MVRTLLKFFPKSSFRKKEIPSFTITIPDPCSEDWSKMQVVDDMHRHCGACERTLVDFSVMSDTELVIFFKHNKGKVCGRFRKDQTNRSLTQLPEKSSKATWWKAAALLPLSLFSKNASAQQLPDSLQTTQTPMMLLPDSTSKCEPVVADGRIITVTEPWKWHLGEEVYLMGIPPLPHTDFRIEWTVDLSVCYPWVDSTALIPHADSSVGMKAAVVAPKKIPNTSEASGFAGNMKSLLPKKEE